MKSLLALHFCIGIYLRKGSKATSQVGVSALGLEAGLPPEGICFQKIQIMRLCIQCFYLVLIGEILTHLSFILILVKYLLLHRSC